MNHRKLYWINFRKPQRRFKQRLVFIIHLKTKFQNKLKITIDRSALLLLSNSRIFPTVEYFNVTGFTHGTIHTFRDACQEMQASPQIQVQKYNCRPLMASSHTNGSSATWLDSRHVPHCKGLSVYAQYCYRQYANTHNAHNSAPPHNSGSPSTASAGKPVGTQLTAEPLKQKSEALVLFAVSALYVYMLPHAPRQCYFVLLYAVDCIWMVWQ